MSCGLALASALLFADPSAGATAASPPPSMALEPLFADIVTRADALKAQADAWVRSDQAARTDFLSDPAFGAFKARAAELAALDMKGHEILRDQGVDGDLKCILRGIAEDLPGRIGAVETAATAEARKLALDELIHLLDDNAAVIKAPPR